MKTSNSLTTMRGNPIKANTGKSDAKFPPSIADVERVGTRLGSKALVPSSPSGVVLTASLNLSSPSMSTSTMALSMLATQSILTSSTPPRALYFSNPTSILKKEPYLIDFIDPKRCEEQMPQVPNWCGQSSPWPRKLIVFPCEQIQATRYSNGFYYIDYHRWW